MSGDIEFHGQAGLAIAFLVALSLIATLLLIGAALREAPGSRLARLALLGFVALCVCNWAGHMLAALRPMLWACLPLQALAIVAAWIALRRTRHRTDSRVHDSST